MWPGANTPHRPAAPTGRASCRRHPPHRFTRFSRLGSQSQVLRSPLRRKGSWPGPSPEQGVIHLAGISEPYHISRLSWGQARAQVRSGVGLATTGHLALTEQVSHDVHVCALPNTAGGQSGFCGNAQPGRGRWWLWLRIGDSGLCSVPDDLQSPWPASAPRRDSTFPTGMMRVSGVVFKRPLSWPRRWCHDLPEPSGPAGVRLGLRSERPGGGLIPVWPTWGLSCVSEPWSPPPSAGSQGDQCPCEFLPRADSLCLQLDLEKVSFGLCPQVDQ